MQRKLTAILSADVKDYSRLVTDDDAATVRTLTNFRTIMTDRIERFGGRVVDAPGDNLLAEFNSVVDALECAVDLQTELRTRNLDQPAKRRMHFRMGVNFGDVIVEGERIYGDGVNIAARLESLAPPGGICISENVLNEVEHKISLTYEDYGTQQVKNIDRPIRVWGIDLGDTGDRRAAEKPAIRRERSIFRFLTKDRIPAAVLFLVALTFGFYYWTQDDHEGVTDASIPVAQSDAEIPSIVVLPLVNRSDDPTQEYFSDGITEDLITDLTKLPYVDVASRTSAFRYKGQAVPLQQISEALNIRYVVEGSVRKMSDQVRITVQLVDAIKDRQLWSERYDRSLANIFDLQDEIRGKILTALRVKLSAEEQERLDRHPTDNLEAYDYFLRGQAMLRNARVELNPIFMESARDLFQQAIDLDPKYASAHLGIGLSDTLNWWYQWNDSAENPFSAALARFEKAELLDSNNPIVQGHIVHALIHLDRHDDAIEKAQNALRRFPADPAVLRALGEALVFGGRAEEAIPLFERLLATGSVHRIRVSGWIIALAFGITGDTDKAISILNNAIADSPNFLSNHLALAFLHHNRGENMAMNTEVEIIRRISPKFSATDIERRFRFQDRSVTADFVAALRAEGG